MTDEKIVKKALDILLNAGIKSIEDLDFIDYAIEDYKSEFGCDLNKYQEMVRELREGYWGLKSENTR